MNLTAWEHVNEAHRHLLKAYSMIDATQFYADTLNRALRNAALTMGQMPVSVSKKRKTICPRCKGRKYLINPATNMNEECSKCSGIGRV